MNHSSQQFIGLTILALFVIGGGYVLVDRTYLSPRSQLVEELEAARGYVDTFQAGVNRKPRVERDTRDIVNRTLGGDVQSVDHRLRSRLNHIAEAVGLSGASVNASSPSARRSPARRQFRDPELRDEPDFVEVGGVVTAEGSIEQAIELIDRIDAEPWIKRIEQVRLDPRDNGRRVNVRVVLTTMFLPGRESTETVVATYAPERMGRFISLLDTNPFRVPPPEEPEETRVVETEEPEEPTFPWEQWIVTGVAEGRDGYEAWLRNRSSGETLRLTVGETLDEARFVAINDDKAIFELEEKRFLVAVGSDLNDRTVQTE